MTNIHSNELTEDADKLFESLLICKLSKISEYVIMHSYDVRKFS
jgi:hypothetical protein